MEEQGLLWEVVEIADCIECTKPLYDELFIRGIEFNSKNVKDGDLFIAMQGEYTDGHKYVNDAFSRGAAAALVSRIPDCLSKEEREKLFLVKDTKQAMISLAKFRRSQLQGKVIGVTGSVGKSSTKNMLLHYQKQHRNVSAAVRSFNNENGVCISMMRTPRDVDCAIYEMGMDKAGEIANLSSIIQPDIAVITTVGKAHLGAFDKVKDIADAKAEIFSHCASNAIAILNHDNEYFNYLCDCAINYNVNHIISFGKHPESDVRLLSIEHNAGRLDVIVSIFGDIINIHTGWMPDHQVMNFLIVLAVESILQEDFHIHMNDIISLPWCSMKGRGQLSEIVVKQWGNDSGILVMDESYNANPVSMKAAIKSFGSLKSHPFVKNRNTGYCYAVLGDMLGLGKTEDYEHAALSEIKDLENFDRIITVGKQMKSMMYKLPEHLRGPSFIDVQSAIEYVVNIVSNGDLVFIKGSNAIGLSHMVQDLQQLGSMKYINL